MKELLNRFWIAFEDSLRDQQNKMEEPHRHRALQVEPFIVLAKKAGGVAIQQVYDATDLESVVALEAQLRLSPDAPDFVTDDWPPMDAPWGQQAAMNGIERKTWFLQQTEGLDRFKR